MSPPSQQHRRFCASHNQCGRQTYQISRERRHQIVLSARPSVFDFDVLTVNITLFGKPLVERRQLR